MQPDEEGELSTGVPFLRLGSGPPLLVASGLTAEHVNPKGRWRDLSLKWAAPFAEHFTVWMVNRRPGLEEGTTASDLAADYAGAVAKDLGGGAVHVHGTSTGGTVALQLAIDHPHLVRRLVVAASAYRLSDRGRALQQEVAARTASGDARGAWAAMLAALSPPALRLPARGLGWAVGQWFTADDPSDMLRVIEAEDVFDARSSLDRITAPTLVLGGTKDVFYSEELFRGTADGIPDGQVMIYEGKGHAHVAGSKGPAQTALGFLLG
jgi:pimeloyl-ACP methyl ester carboxylesterase